MDVEIHYFALYYKKEKQSHSCSIDRDTMESVDNRK